MHFLPRPGPRKASAYHLDTCLALNPRPRPSLDASANTHDALTPIEIPVLSVALAKFRYGNQRNADGDHEGQR